MISEAQFWELVEGSDLRLELYEGQVFAVECEARPHGLIACSVAHAVYVMLRGRGCTVTASGTYVTSQGSDYWLPDIVIVCGPDQTHPTPHDQAVITNPTILVEVLSPGTEMRDRTIKRDAYLSLPSLRAYLMVSTDQVRVELYQRTPDGFQQTIRVGGTITLEGAEIGIADFYEQVDLAEAPAAGGDQ